MPQESDPHLESLKRERDLLRALMEGGEVHHQSEPCTVQLLKRKREWLAAKRMCLHIKRLTLQHQREGK